MSEPKEDYVTLGSLIMGGNTSRHVETEATEIVNDGKVLISIMCPICGVPVPLFSVGLRYSEDHVAACKLQVCNACGTSVSVDGWIKYAFSMRILDVKVAVPGGAEEDSDGC